MRDSNTIYIRNKKTHHNRAVHGNFNLSSPHASNQRKRSRTVSGGQLTSKSQFYGNTIHSAEGIRDYFVHFLEKRPTGEILESYVSSQRNYATDVGIYEFTFQDGSKVRARYSYLYVKEGGEWKIKHHHSSGMPEAKR